MSSYLGVWDPLCSLSDALESFPVSTENLQVRDGERAFKVKKGRFSLTTHQPTEGRASQDLDRTTEIMMLLDRLTITPVKQLIDSKARRSLPLPVNTEYSSDIYRMDPGENYLQKRLIRT